MKIYLFLAAMWGLIIMGGGIAVLVLGPISVSGLGEYDRVAGSALQAAAALLLVVLWIFILARVKNYVFRSDVRWDKT
ncbi:MAG: hypothetical protein EB830_00475 [Nitrosopumilus sp. H13]|nr:MAG: hypothetical protein EB830_00475 [Nitrosopumilus sp. H13]